MKKLCIDPGHGMANAKPGTYDPGAHFGNLTEAEVTLQWALTVKWVFRLAGFEVFLTRDDDRDADPVGQRNDKAQEAGCTHFVSIHCNAGGGSRTETYYRDDLAWAKAVQAAAVKATGLKDGGVHPEGQSQHTRLAVMDFRGQACLVEIGFIDTPKDRVVLTSRAARIRFAEELLKVWRAL